MQRVVENQERLRKRVNDRQRKGLRLRTIVKLLHLVVLHWAGASHDSQPPARLAIAGDGSAYTLSGKDPNLNQGYLVCPLWVESGHYARAESQSGSGTTTLLFASSGGVPIDAQIEGVNLPPGHVVRRHDWYLVYSGSGQKSEIHSCSEASV